MHLIIDSDPIVYRCGFAAERADYHLVFETPGGEIIEKLFKPGDKQTAGAAMKKYVDAHKGFTILSKEKIVTPDSEDDALGAVRTQLYSIEKAVREHCRSEFTEITVILSGPGNYRERLATIAPYKGNRDSSHKPYWYQSIRNNLTSEWGAIVVHGREADDEASILAKRCRNAGTEYVIATIDKDLDQIPGRHYNYLKSVYYTQSDSDAESFFWRQSLVGDATDGIPGCYLAGESAGDRFVEQTVSRYLGRNDRRSIWSALVQAYERSKTLSGCPYAEKDAAAVALETARLVYLQQEEGELWISEGPPHDKLPEYIDAQ